MGRAGARADAIVALGGGIGGDGAASRRSAERTRAAARLWREGQAPLVVLSGGRSSAGTTEAEAMAAVAVREGVPRERLRLEASSLNTFENAVYTAALLRALDATHVLLVTSPLHVRRAVAVFRRAGVHVTPFFDAEAAPEGVRSAVHELGALGLFKLLGFC